MGAPRQLSGTLWELLGGPWVLQGSSLGALGGVLGALGGSLGLVEGPWGRKRKHANTACGKSSEMHYAQRLKRISGKTATAEHHGQIDFGRGSGDAISYRSALEDFGQKNQEESRKGSSAL